MLTRFLRYLWLKVTNRVMESDDSIFDSIETSLTKGTLAPSLVLSKDISNLNLSQILETDDHVILDELSDSEKWWRCADIVLGAISTFVTLLMLGFNFWSMVAVVALVWFLELTVYGLADSYSSYRRYVRNSYALREILKISPERYRKIGFLELTKEVDLEIRSLRKREIDSFRQSQKSEGAESFLKGECPHFVRSNELIHQWQELHGIASLLGMTTTIPSDEELCYQDMAELVDPRLASVRRQELGAPHGTEIGKK